MTSVRHIHDSNLKIFINFKFVEIIVRIKKIINFCNFQNVQDDAALGENNAGWSERGNKTGFDDLWG